MQQDCGTQISYAPPPRAQQIWKAKEMAPLPGPASSIASVPPPSAIIVLPPQPPIPGVPPADERVTLSPLVAAAEPLLNITQASTAEPLKSNAVSHSHAADVSVVSSQQLASTVDDDASVATPRPVLQGVVHGTVDEQLHGIVHQQCPSDLPSAPVNPSREPLAEPCPSTAASLTITTAHAAAPQSPIVSSCLLIAEPPVPKAPAIVHTACSTQLHTAALRNSPTAHHIPPIVHIVAPSVPSSNGTLADDIPPILSSLSEAQVATVPVAPADTVVSLSSFPVASHVVASADLHDSVEPTMSPAHFSPSSAMTTAVVALLPPSAAVADQLVPASNVCFTGSTLHMPTAASAQAHAAAVGASVVSTVAQLELLPTPSPPGRVHPSLPSYKHVLVDNSLQVMAPPNIGFPPSAIAYVPGHAIVVSQARDTFVATPSALSLGTSSLLQLQHAPALDTGFGSNDSDYYQDSLVSDEFGHGDCEDTDEHTYEDITDGSEDTHRTKMQDRRKLKGSASKPMATIDDFTTQSKLLDMRIRKRGRPPGSRNRTYFDVQRTMSTRATRATSD